MNQPSGDQTASAGAQNQQSALAFWRSEANISSRKSARGAPLPQKPLPAIHQRTAPRTASAEAVIRAISQLGTPYNWGGETAGKGFDCSGLTNYIYEKADINLPRTVRTQYRAVHHIPRSKLQPGDLVFFRIHHRHVDHVGVYVGDHRFIHAPRTGEHVKFSNLDKPYWRRHFVAGGRVPGSNETMQLAENP